MKQRTAIIVVSGTQGAGKTTVARLLAQRFERGAHISGDRFHRMIVSGGLWPEERDMSFEAARQLRLRLRNACLVARSFFENGFTAVLDDIIVGDRFRHLINDLARLEFFFVMLVPSPQAVRERELGRGTNLFEEWEWLTEEILGTPERLGLWVDTSDMTAEQTVDEILDRVWSEGRISHEGVWAEDPPIYHGQKRPDGVTLVTGVPGAGKSTVGRLLAARFDRSAHIETDLLQHELTLTGLVDPSQRPESERRAQLALRRRNASLLAESFFRAGFLPVLDEAVCSRYPLETYQRLLTMKPLRLIVLAPQLGVVEARDKARDKHVFQVWSHLDQSLRAELPGLGLWIDTSEMNAEETVDLILERWNDAVLD